MSSLFGTAVAVEARKAAASRVMSSISAILIGGLAVLTLGMLLGAASGDEQVIAKLGPLAGAGGWEGLVGIVVQITSAGGLLAFGVALSWMFGREFADGTVSGLFALPVRRSTIAVAKLFVYLAWTLAVSAALTAAVAIIGVALGYGATDAAGAGALARVPTLVVLTALIAVPAAWAATRSGGGCCPASPQASASSCSHRSRRSSAWANGCPSWRRRSGRSRPTRCRRPRCSPCRRCRWCSARSARLPGTGCSSTAEPHRGLRSEGSECLDTQR